MNKQFEEMTRAEFIDFVDQHLAELDGTAIEHIFHWQVLTLSCKMTTLPVPSWLGWAQLKATSITKPAKQSFAG